MDDIKVDTANIPQHISDAICDDLLKSIKENPGAAQALEERGRALFQRIAAKKAQEAKENK